MKLPLANAIAIDPDQIATLTYAIVSVRILNMTHQHQKSQRRHRQKHETNSNSGEQQIVGGGDVDVLTSDLFYMNATNGHLYALKSEMPCKEECIIHIQYRADDQGRFKTRVSRKRMIKLNVKPLPLSLFNINENVVDTDDMVPIDYKKTFELDTDNTEIYVNEDTKIGEKLFKIGVKSRGKSIVFFSLSDESNLNQTFYMSNNDGTLYLIKQLDVESGYDVFNLTVLVTNWVGQIEHVYLRVNVRDVNDNVPKFERIVLSLNETLTFDTIFNNEEDNIDSQVNSMFLFFKSLPFLKCLKPEKVILKINAYHAFIYF